MEGMGIRLGVVGKGAENQAYNPLIIINIIKFEGGTNYVEK